MDWREAERAVWTTLGRLASAELADHGRAEVLFRLDLDRLCHDPEFRAAGRGEVLAAGERLWDRGAERVWDLDARTFTHRVKLLLPWDEDDEHRTKARLDVLGLGLLHPNDSIVWHAAQAVRAERERRRPLPRLTDHASLAAEGEVDERADEWTRHWAEWGNAGWPVDRDLVEDGIRRCYELWNQPWHGRIVWVESPFAAALVAWLRSATLWTTGSWLSQVGGGQQWQSRGDDLRSRMDQDLRYVAGLDLFRRAGTVGDAVWSRLGLRSALAHLFTGSFPEDGRHLGATDPAQVRRTLQRVGEQVPGVAPEHVRAMLDAVESGPGTIWCPRIPGQLLAPWLARATLLEEVCGRRPAGSLWDRVAAYRDANAAGPWTAHQDYAVVSERPVAVRSERMEVPGQSHPRHQLHAENEPAVVWADGAAGYVVHGMRLPFDLMRYGWSAEQILDERNTDVRRVAIERLGWDRFPAEAGLTLIHGPVPDPGNPGNTLSLYDLPTRNGLQARLLLCTNASPERDGTVRHFGLQVPATMHDAVAAAAWTFDVDPTIYRHLLRAT
jgi:hypothetical protein